MTTNPGLSVEVPKLEKLNARLADPDFIGGPLRDLLTTASIHAEGVAKNTAPKDTGALTRDLMSEVKPLQARVFTKRDLVYYNTMEYGRRAGATPPSGNKLVAWAARKGLSKSAAFAIARSIGRRGIKGRFFMKAGADSARNKMPGWLAAMGAKIGVNFEKPL